MGATARGYDINYSEGVSITSAFHADPVTVVEPVRYPAGSSLLRFLAGPLIESGGGLLARLLQVLKITLRRPLDFLRAHVFFFFSFRTTILLVMQTEDNRMRVPALIRAGPRPTVGPGL